ncbi:MAG: hypothetical protein WCI51_22605 [Lentisphaerota bacterium]
MEPLAKIAYSALDEITRGQFIKLPKLAIAGLLDDFQYSWLRRFQIVYDFEMLNAARCLCSGGNKAVFRATNCKNIEEIRKTFSVYIEQRHKDDDRVIYYLSFDGKKINAEWFEMEEYLEATRPDVADSKTDD